MSEQRNGGELLLDQLRSSLQVSRYSASSVLAALAVSLGGAIICFVLFCTLRPRMKHLYSSKSQPKYEPLDFPYPGDGVFSWLKPACKTNEVEYKCLGVDATLYLRFIRMMTVLFIFVAVLTCGVGIPINVIFNLRSRFSESLSSSDAFIMMTPSLLSGTQIIAHVIIAWAIDICVMVLLWRNFRAALRLRREALLSPAHQAAISSRTILVYDLKSSARKDFLSHCRQWNAENPTGYWQGVCVQRLEGLVEQHKKAVRKLEYYLTKYERQSQLHPETAKRPVVSPGRGQPKTDAIDYYTSCYRQLEHDIEQERMVCRKEHAPEPYGFISYPRQAIAHRVAYQWHRTRVQGGRVHLAPEPADIIWPNLMLTSIQRKSKHFWMNFIFATLLVVWIVPNAFIGCFLSNLSRLAAMWPAFGMAMAQNRVGFAILQGVLAPVITTLIFMILPYIFRKLSRWQGKVTRNQREKEVLRKLYAFFFLINFFVFTMMGVVWDIVAQTLSILNDNQQNLPFSVVFQSLRIPERISSAIINMSSFWVMYLLRAIIGLALDFVQCVTLVQRVWQNIFREFTPRDRIERRKPEPYPYAVQYLWPFFYATIALGFTSIQPIISLVTAFYFVMALPLKKYALMFMFYTKHESYGGFWPIVNNTIIFATGFGNLIMFCLVWVQADWRPAAAVAPLIVMMALFKVATYIVFDKNYYFFDDEQSTLNNSDTNYDLAECYENPVLYCELDKPIAPCEANLSSSQRSSFDQPEKLRNIFFSSKDEENDLFGTPDILPGSRLTGGYKGSAHQGPAPQPFDPDQSPVFNRPNQTLTEIGPHQGLPEIDAHETLREMNTHRPSPEMDPGSVRFERQPSEHLTEIGQSASGQPMFPREPLEDVETPTYAWRPSLESVCSHDEAFDPTALYQFYRNSSHDLVLRPGIGPETAAHEREADFEPESDTRKLIVKRKPVP